MGKFKKSLPKVGRPASREHDHSAVTIRRAASLVLGFDVELFDRRLDRRLGVCGLDLAEERSDTLKEVSG